MGYVAAYKENKSKRAHTAQKILDTDPLDCPVIFFCVDKYGRPLR
jgi:hypothetical protein